VLVVADSRIRAHSPGGAHVSRQSHLDHVEAERGRLVAQFSQVRRDRAAQHPLLAPIHRMEACHPRTGRPRLHLHKDQHLIIAANEVDFLPAIARIAPVAGHDRELAFPLQPVGRLLLAVSADVASRAGALPERFDETCGAFFEGGDAKGLRAVVRRLVARPETVAEWRRAIPPVKTMGDAARRIEEIYAELLAGGARR